MKSISVVKSKILFLDIDGPMIPGRAYTMPDQTKGIVKTFDPCAVGIINNLCDQSGWKIVLHSSWIRVFGGEKTVLHCMEEGLYDEHFHKDAWCDEEENWRYTRVAKWLNAHPETTHYVILDDEPYADDLSNKVEYPAGLKEHLVLVDFSDGIITSTVNKIRGGNWRA